MSRLPNEALRLVAPTIRCRMRIFIHRSGMVLRLTARLIRGELRREPQGAVSLMRDLLPTAAGKSAPRRHYMVTRSVADQHTWVCLEAGYQGQERLRSMGIRMYASDSLDFMPLLQT